MQKGDKQACDLLVIKYQHRILLVGSYIHDHQEVQDITQEAFIKAYKALANFRGDSSFYTWLYRIAINTAKNYLVSKGRKMLESEIDVHDSEFQETSSALRDITTPEGKLTSDEIEKTVHATISDLPDDLKTAVMLRV